MSRIIYVKCDRCGKESVPSETQRIGWIGLNWQNPDTDDLTEDKNPLAGKDYCEDCMRDIAAFIENQPTEINIELPEDDPVTNKIDETLGPVKKPKKNPPKKKGIDKGKIKALHDAGWSKTKIADEMGVSVQAVSYHLDRMPEGGDADDRNGESEA